MRIFERPRVVVSRCFGFEACRYNGEILQEPLVRSLSPFVDFVPVCPEMEIGLGVPRPTLRIVEREGAPALLQPDTGRDLTAEMEAFGRAFLERLGPVDGFLLKSRSPSCALHDARTYPSEGPSAPLGKGPGLFARQVRAREPLAPPEDEGRCRNFVIREHFLTRLFASADLRRLEREGTRGALVRFHSVFKLVLMAHSQKEMRLLGRIVAGAAGRPLGEVLGEYALHFRAALQRPARYTAHANVLLHAFGYFKETLAAREKRHFLQVLDRYRVGRVPLSVPLALLRAWVERFETAYLADQVYFEPYPEALVEITDSGKGRDRSS